MQKIVLATNNLGKVKEFQKLLNNFHCEIIPQSFFNIPEAEETGLTFIENALIKARHAAQLTGLPALADDSGLVIDALNGAPGIYSARYAGEKNNFAHNINKVLIELQNIPEEQRSAHFCCVLAYLKYPSDPLPIIAQGAWEGRILSAPRGMQGFGYDPIFFVPTHNCSAAELSSNEKNKISHRAQALQQLVLQFNNKDKP
jgi:XTP/dITP diphosphohydrolase